MSRWVARGVATTAAAWLLAGCAHHGGADRDMGGEHHAPVAAASEASDAEVADQAAEATPAMDASVIETDAGVVASPVPDASAAASTSAPRRILLGTSVNGRPIEALVHGAGDVHVLILATIHGDEWAGTPLLETTSAMISEGGFGSELLDGRTITLVPIVNPDGFAARRRGNVNGVDLNRNFAADNRQDRERFGAAAESEPEAEAIARVVDGTVLGQRPDMIVSIHQPVAVVDWDGPAPAADVARRMGMACDLPARRIGSRPGSLGSWAGETLGIPTITFELPPEAGQDPAADEARYLPALEAAMTFIPSSPTPEG